MSIRNHFEEWLHKIHGPYKLLQEDIYLKIRNEIGNREINVHNIKLCLKKNGLSKYYEDIQDIIHNLNNNKTHRFPPENIEKFLDLFDKIQEPHRKYSIIHRVGFPSYTYIIYKFSQILNLAGYEKYGSDKYDNEFKFICQELGLEFIPSARFERKIE